MGKIDERLTVLEGAIKENKASIDRIVEIMLRELNKDKKP